MAGKRIGDHQVNSYKKLRTKLAQKVAAAKVGISVRSARRIDEAQVLVRRSSDYEEVDARFTKYSTMTVKNVLYTTPSRLVGQRLKVRVSARHCVAVTLARGCCTLAEFDITSVYDPYIASLRDRIDMVVEDACDFDETIV